MIQQQQLLPCLDNQTKKTKSKIIKVICNFCKKIFEVTKYYYKHKLLRLSNNKFYCDRVCSAKDRPAKQDNFFWCQKCKWIPKSEAKFKPKGSVNFHHKSEGRIQEYVLKRNQFYCPKCNEKLVCKNPRKNKEKKRI